MDSVHRHPMNRRGWPAAAAEASVRGARASAALDGGDPRIPGPDTGGAVQDPVLAGALRIAESIGPLLPTWQRAPLQALARLHVLAAADLAPDDALGRPRVEPGVAHRLDLLAGLVAGGTSVPGPVLAAVVHGELLTLAPFDGGNGVVARAAGRLTLIATGLDPKGLTVPEVHYLRNETAYRSCAEAFASGEPDGLVNWLLLGCDAIQTGAREAVGIADAALSAPPSG